jgi:ribosomal protein S6
MFLFDSNLAARDWPGLEKHVRDLLEKNAAELVYSERWPDRKLSYEIKGCKKGTYYLTYFKGPPTAVQGLTRDCELSERVLRLLVLYDEILEADCQKRINREVTGSPEEIEERRERSRREAQGIEPTGEEPAVAGETSSSSPGGDEGGGPGGRHGESRGSRREEVDLN